MSFTYTTNYTLAKPGVGTEKDAWGDDINSDFDLIDAAIKAREDNANTRVLKAGDTMTGLLITAPANASRAGIRIADGTAPSSPTNGDFWATSGVLKYRSAGVTVDVITTAGWAGTLNGVNLTLSGNLIAVLGTFSGKVTTPASATGGAGLILPHGAAPTSPVNGDIWTTTAAVFARLNSVTQTLMTLAGGTLTGLLATVASATGSAGLRIPHGAAPTSPVDGDFWSTTAAFFARINGVTQTLMTLAGGTMTGIISTLASGASSAGLRIPHGSAPSSPTNGDIWSTTTAMQFRMNGATRDFAFLDSPTFTGTPAAPLAAANTDTTQLATTSYAMQQDRVYQENMQTGAGTYTLVLTDAGKVVGRNNASANDITVPPNASVAFPIGTWIDVYQYGAGKTTIVAGAGVTIRSAGGVLGLAQQYSGGTLIKRATNEWVLFGDLG